MQAGLARYNKRREENEGGSNEELGERRMREYLRVAETVNRRFTIKTDVKEKQNE